MILLCNFKISISILLFFIIALPTLLLSKPIHQKSQFGGIFEQEKQDDSNRPILRFNKKGKFKIVQFTDLHYGEHESYDKLNLIAQENVIKKENPDYVMLSGDMFSAYKIFDSDKYPILWEMVTRSMRSRNIPWSLTFGNHDCEGPLTGREIVEMDRSFSNLSLTKENRDPTIPGITNYNLKIYSSNFNNNTSTSSSSSSSNDEYDKNNNDDDNELMNVSSSIYIFDSDLPQCNGTGSWGCIDEAQVDWYKKVSNDLGNVPSIAFVHIPPVEVIDLWNENTVYGDYGDKEVCCYYTDQSDFVNSMIEQGDVKGLYFGHDHKNDYHGIYKGSIELGYGRKSGYGSYNPKYLEGARVIELTENPFQIKTWIRNSKGEIDHQKTHFPNPFSQTPRYCCTPQDHSKPDPWPAFLISYCLIIILLSLIYYKLKVNKQRSDKFSNNLIQL